MGSGENEASPGSESCQVCITGPGGLLNGTLDEGGLGGSSKALGAGKSGVEWLEAV